MGGPPGAYLISKKDRADLERPINTIYVMLTCTGDKIDEQDVKFENIEEDMQGRDILTFKCPECGEIHKSLRFG